MKRTLMVGALATMVAFAPAFAATDAECEAMWKAADINADGVVTDTEATRYLAAYRITERQVPADGRFTKAAFIDACKADVFVGRPIDSGAPLKGSNSFTENQARDRAVARGVTEISAMSKDGDGIWRGKGRFDSKDVSVAVDYKGNVVTQ